MRREQNVQLQEHDLQDQATRAIIDNFNDAFNRHDVFGLEALLTDDTVFENTSPAPDAGSRESLR
jgi:ketosteroid isomerase-like protein